MSDFLEQLRAGVRLCQMLGKRVLVGVSGGADSVALLRGLMSIANDTQLQIHVGHFDHNLRETAKPDADWVRALAATHGVPIDSECAGSFAAAEESARGLRYAFFQLAANRMGCEVVALAHTANDQAETVLHHIIRGTGLPGLCGIPQRRRLSSALEVVRPMLSMTRDDVIGYLKQIDQDFRVDETNQDTKYTRNRIRHNLLPQLRTELNVCVDAALRGLADQATAVVEWMDDAAEDVLAKSLVDCTVGQSSDAGLGVAVDDLTSIADACRLDCRALAGLKPVIVRHVFVRLWARLNWPRKRMSSRDWSRLATLVQTESAAENLPGNVDARRRGHLLVLRRKPIGVARIREQASDPDLNAGESD